MNEASNLEGWVGEAVPFCSYWEKHNEELCGRTDASRYSDRWLCPYHVAVVAHYSHPRVQLYAGYQVCSIGGCEQPGFIVFTTRKSLPERPPTVWCRLHYGMAVGVPPPPPRKKTL